MDGHVSEFFWTSPKPSFVLTESVHASYKQRNALIALQTFSEIKIELKNKTNKQTTHKRTKCEQKANNNIQFSWSTLCALLKVVNVLNTVEPILS